MIIRYKVPRILMGKYVGKVIYPFILFKEKREEVSDQLKRHELEHYYQIKRTGVIRWYLSYFNEWRKKGYKGNKYEIEADRISEQPLTAKEKQQFDKGKDSRFFHYAVVLLAVILVVGKWYLE